MMVTTTRRTITHTATVTAVMSVDGSVGRLAGGSVDESEGRPVGGSVYEPVGGSEGGSVNESVGAW